MDERIRELCGIVRQTGFDLHCYLKHGHLEKVYENGLLYRLRKAGLCVEQQHPLCVRDQDGTVLGDYFADLFIESCLLAEVKAVTKLTDEHIAQLLGYMRTTGVEHGLLINFGGPQFQIRKYVLSRRAAE